MPHPRSSSWRAVAAVTILVPALATAIAAEQAAAPVVVIRAARMLDLSRGCILGTAPVVVTGREDRGGESARVPGRRPDHGPGRRDLASRLHRPAHSPGWATSWRPPSPRGPRTDADAAFSSVGNAEKTVRAGFTTVRDFGGEITVALGKARLLAHPGSHGWFRRGSPRDYRRPLRRHRLRTGHSGGRPQGGHRRRPRGSGPGRSLPDQAWRAGHQVVRRPACFRSKVPWAPSSTPKRVEGHGDEAARHGVKVAAHAHGNDGIMAAVRAGVTTSSTLPARLRGDRTHEGTGDLPGPYPYLVDRINLAVLPPLVAAPRPRPFCRSREKA